VPRIARDVVFVDGVRTPFGKAGPKGLFAETRADDMIVSVIRELLRRSPALPPERSWPGCRNLCPATPSTGCAPGP
jgi:acetyl-CoA acyltransferase